jgi:glycosyltransferase involved in cell wall biosynthesis
LFDGTPPPRSAPLRLAIISTYDEMCGIAGYTRALEQQLRSHADVTVFDLDQYLLRSPHARVQRLADRHIREIAGRLKHFDSVNIQLEYGTLGRTASQIVRRFRRLAGAAPRLSVTFHTILGHETLDWVAIGRTLVTGRIFRLFKILGSYRRDRGLSALTYGFLRRFQHRRTVHAIVHTKRDARLLHDVYGIRNVVHHPLSFVAGAHAERIRATATREQFPILCTLPPDAKLIGSFGFLSPYKGFETVVNALHYLPEDHHLLIFGGIHPQSIKREQPLDPYIQTLLDKAHIGHSLFDTIDEKSTSLSLSIDASSQDILSRHPGDLQKRIHFLGVHNDENFMSAMALEMGCRVLASRTLAFLQFARYHPNQIDFFDIGNYAELADLIRAQPPVRIRDRELSYNVQTNTALYLAANQPRSRAGNGHSQKVTHA